MTGVNDVIKNCLNLKMNFIWEEKEDKESKINMRFDVATMGSKERRQSELP